MIIPILPQTAYNYSYLVAPATQDVIVADNIPVAGAKTVALSVRIHRLAFSAGASFRFYVYGVDPSSTDGTVFINTNAIGDTGAISTSSTNLIGLTSIITDPVHPYVRVVLQMTGPGSAGNCYAELSADLVVREAAGVQSSRAMIQKMSRALYPDLRAGSNGTPLANFPDSIGLDPQAATSPLCIITGGIILRCLISGSCGPSNHGGPCPPPDDPYTGPDQGGGGDGE